MYTQEEINQIMAYYEGSAGIGLEELDTMSESEYKHVIGMRGLAHGLMEKDPYINDEYKDDVFSATPVTSRLAVKLTFSGALLIRVDENYQQVGKQIESNWKPLTHTLLETIPDGKTSDGSSVWLLPKDLWLSALPEETPMKREPKQGIFARMKKAILK